MDLLQDRLRSEYACHTYVLSAASFLTRHISAITQEPFCHSTMYVRAQILSSRNFCLKNSLLVLVFSRR
jgi:hypothetical protein